MKKFMKYTLEIVAITAILLSLNMMVNAPIGDAMIVSLFGGSVYFLSTKINPTTWEDIGKQMKLNEGSK